MRVTAEIYALSTCGEVILAYVHIRAHYSLLPSSLLIIIIQDSFHRIDDAINARVE